MPWWMGWLMYPMISQCSTSWFGSRKEIQYRENPNFARGFSDSWRCFSETRGLFWLATPGTTYLAAGFSTTIHQIIPEHVAVICWWNLMDMASSTVNGGYLKSSISSENMMTNRCILGFHFEILWESLRDKSMSFLLFPETYSKSEVSTTSR